MLTESDDGAVESSGSGGMGGSRGSGGSGISPLSMKNRFEVVIFSAGLNILNADSRWTHSCSEDTDSSCDQSVYNENICLELLIR